MEQEQIVVEEQKGKTSALIETIRQEKSLVDEAVEAGRGVEEAAAKLQVRLALCDFADGRKTLCVLHLLSLLQVQTVCESDLSPPCTACQAIIYSCGKYLSHIPVGTLALCALITEH